ncbi:hypothetical protein [Rhodococcus qingshengii]
MQASDYKSFVVLDSDPAPGVRALTPSALKEKGLDTLRIIQRADADAAGVEVPTRTVNNKTFTASGPGGTAFQKIVDQVSTFTIRTVSDLTLKVTADEAKGTGDIDLAVAALGMLPKYSIAVTSTLVAEYKNLTGGLRFTGTAERADFQSAYGNVKKALSGAAKIAGDITLEVVFEPPVDIDTANISQIHAVIKNLQIKQTTMTAEVTR